MDARVETADVIVTIFDVSIIQVCKTLIKVSCNNIGLCKCSGIIDDRTGNQREAAATDVDFSAMDPLECAQHIALMRRIPVINVETGTEDRIRPEVGQVFAQISLGITHHFQHRVVAVNDLAVRIGHHDTVRRHIQGHLDTQGFLRRLALGFDIGLELALHALQGLPQDLPADRRGAR